MVPITKTKTNYALIYKIVSNKVGTYVGLTHEKYLSIRAKNHRAQFKRWKMGKSKKFCYSFKVLEDEEATFTFLESVKYEGEWRGNDKLKKLLSSKELYWKNKLDALNKNVPGRTKAERDQNLF